MSQAKNIVLKQRADESNADFKSRIAEATGSAPSDAVIYVVASDTPRIARKARKAA
jgi:hypothetical protein